MQAYGKPYEARALTVRFEDLFKLGDVGTWLWGLYLKMALCIQYNISPNDQG